MNESERSEAYGTPHDSGMSSDEAAELEELRREAALLREQLENAVGPQSGLRSARDVHQLEARIDSLASRNAKLMETLKEARQQLLALREEVDRLGQPPSGYGVLLSVQEDDTVDVFTSGRKMRLAAGAAVGALSLLAAACSTSSSSSAPNAGGGTKIKGGTVTWAELPASPANYIFPFLSLAYFSVSNSQDLQAIMYS